MVRSQRITKQKTAVLDTLRSVNNHPTAEWLYQEARKRIPGLSLGTVYRNLNQLKDNGEITELNYGNGQSRFDGRKDNHYHFCCTACGSVMDLYMPMVKTLDTKARTASNCQVSGHRLEFYGICDACAGRAVEVS